VGQALADAAAKAATPQKVSSHRQLLHRWIMLLAYFIVCRGKHRRCKLAGYLIPSLDSISSIASKASQVFAACCSAFFDVVPWLLNYRGSGSATFQGWATTTVLVFSQSLRLEARLTDRYKHASRFLWRRSSRYTRVADRAYFMTGLNFRSSAEKSTRNFVRKVLSRDVLALFVACILCGRSRRSLRAMASCLGKRFAMPPHLDKQWKPWRCTHLDRGMFGFPMFQR